MVITLWTKKFDLDSVTVGTSAIQTSDGGYALTGWSRGPDPVNLDDSVFIIKTTSTGVVGVREGLSMPPTFLLHQNYPNPFNPSMKIRFSLPSRTSVTLTVYDLLGQEAASLVNEEKTAGTFEVNFDARGLSSGVYFYKIQAGNFVDTKRMLLLK